MPSSCVRPFCPGSFADKSWSHEMASSYFPASISRRACETPSLAPRPPGTDRVVWVCPASTAESRKTYVTSLIWLAIFLAQGGAGVLTCPAGWSPSFSRIRRLRHPNIFVRASIIEEIACPHRHHTLNEDHIGHLARSFPIPLWSKYRLLAAPQQLSRIIAIEHGHRSAIHQLVVRCVIKQHDAVLRQDGGRARLHPPGIELPRPP